MSAKYTVVKIHSTKWAVMVEMHDLTDTVATFKTKGAAAQRIEELKAAAVVKSPKRRAESVRTGLSRKECIAKLAESGYTGPISYLMPKLREIVAKHAA